MILHRSVKRLAVLSVCAALLTPPVLGLDVDDSTHAAHMQTAGIYTDDSL